MAAELKVAVAAVDMRDVRLFSPEESDKGKRHWSYAPHRAILALGAVLILVGAAGGTVGAVNSARAERSAAILTDRYLVLQPPVRNLRASVADFQAVAEQAFTGSAIDAALLAKAVQQSTVTDQAYLVVQRLLSLPVNSTLAPGLADLQAAYVASRTGLASLLAAGTQSSQSAQVAVDERAANKNLDDGLATLQQNTTDRLVATANRALRTFAQILRDGLRPTDLPCRYGGEEFLVVLPSCQVQEACAVLERVRQHLAVRLTSGQIPSFTVSFGVASSEQAPDFEQTVALADEALLHAKAMGRDRIVVAEPGPRVDSDTDSDPLRVLVTPS